jgi:hypothetical protein
MQAATRDRLPESDGLDEVEELTSTLSLGDSEDMPHASQAVVVLSPPPESVPADSAGMYRGVPKFWTH